MKKIYQFTYNDFSLALEKSILFDKESVLHNRVVYKTKLLIGDNSYILEVELL